jgi:hypothetical protein
MASASFEKMSFFIAWIYEKCSDICEGIWVLNVLILYLVQLNIFLSIYHIFVKLLYLVPLMEKYVWVLIVC